MSVSNARDNAFLMLLLLHAKVFLFSSSSSLVFE